MEKIKSFTSLKQSRRLGKFLPNESADMYYFTIIRDYPRSQGKIKTISKLMDGSFSSNYDIPCWSLAALLNTLPSATLDSSDNHRYRFRCMERYTEWYDNAIDACVAMIEKLHELKIL